MATTATTMATTARGNSPGGSARGRSVYVSAIAPGRYPTMRLRADERVARLHEPEAEVAQGHDPLVGVQCRRVRRHLVALDAERLEVLVVGPLVQGAREQVVVE